MPAHEVDHVGAEELDLTAVPFLDGVLGKSSEAFMVSVHKGDCERQVFEKRQLDFVSPSSVPQDTAVAANDYGVRFCHGPHFRETVRAEPGEISVGVACNIDHICRLH